jgi:hypothetical protein
VGHSQSGIWYTCVHAKAAANRSNVYVMGKNNKILPIPETMQGISTSEESKKEENSKKKKKNFIEKLVF